MIDYTLTWKKLIEDYPNAKHDIEALREVKEYCYTLIIVGSFVSGMFVMYVINYVGLI